MVCHTFELKNDMTMINKQKKKIIIMVPYPAQGHVTPMLKLASSFSTLGFRPLIVLPAFLHRRIADKTRGNIGIEYVSISDGLEDETKPRDFFAIERAMEDHMPAHLNRLIREINGDDDDGDDDVAFMVVDLLASWAIDVGRKCGVEVTGFWPAMVATYCLITAIPDMVQRGLISDSGLPQLQGSISFKPDQPLLNIEDLPWLIGSQTSKQARFKFWARTLYRSKSLRWLLVNSFPNESQSSFDPINLGPNPTNGPHIYPIGPLRDNGLIQSPNFWEEDVSCLDWLDQQKPNSVIYISFGSWVSPIGDAKVKNLALALEYLRRPFIWVIGPTWRDGLPNGYIERVGRRIGKIVAWAPQMDVLQHKAVGCYLTHCGWNSTMEAIQCRKCLLCFPVAGDQFLNCEYIVNVWRIGVKLNGFSIKDVEDGIKRVMEDQEMKKRMEKLSEKIMREEAILKSENNILCFLKDLRRPTVNYN